MLLAGFSAKAQNMNIPDTVQSAEGIRVETAIDRAEIYIGDLINYRLTIYHDSDIVLTPPPIGANLGAFDVKDYQADDTRRTNDGKYKIESRFALTTFTTGDYIIPPIPVEYMTPDSVRHIIVSEAIAIKVKSLLGEEAGDSLDIRDLKPQYVFASSNRWLYYTIAGILLAALVVGYLIWRRKRRMMETGEPVDLRDPWEIAFEKLAYLKETDYLEKKKYKQYYVDLSDIFREYIGRMYHFPALDMTTFELLSKLEEMELEPSLYGRIGKLLNFSDLVKFAKFEPDASRPMFDFDEVHEIVEYVRQIEQTKLSQIEPVATTASKEEAGV